MKRRMLSVGIGLTPLLLFVALLQFNPPSQAQQTAPPPVTLKINTYNIGGAFELETETPPYGKIRVYLPDDMRAGDTISGTLAAEPKGNTEEERARNLVSLDNYVVQVGDQKVPASKGAFNLSFPPQPLQTDFLLSIIELPSGKELAKTSLPVFPTPPSATQPQTLTPNDFLIPVIGQQGRPVEIFGPFDGNAANTSLRLSTGGSSAPETLKPLAESPRKIVFRTPFEGTGPAEIKLKEGDVETTGQYRRVGVRLSAPKTNLTRGEKTTVTVEVSGLEGIKQDVPLQLDTRGVVQMDGGNFQNLQIRPTEVKPGGLYTTTRGITGQQAGSFSVTATVIVRPYDVCLADDSLPARSIRWNTFTGDYIITNPSQPRPPGGTGQTGGTTGGAGGAKPPGTEPPLPPVNVFGTGRPQLKGCIITLSHNAPDRRVFAKLDVCTKTGEAEVQTSAPKEKVAVTDRNTADSTCAAPPPK